MSDSPHSPAALLRRRLSEAALMVAAAALGFAGGALIGQIESVRALGGGGLGWIFPALIGALATGGMVQAVLSARRIGDLRVEALRRGAAEEEALRLAMHDQLTGLANRWLLENRLGRAIGHVRRHGDLFVLLLVEITNLPQIQSLWGRDHVDAMLRDVAGRLLKASRETDTIARIGEGQFGMLMTTIHERRHVNTIIEKTLRALEPPVQLAGGSEILLSAAVGCVLHPDDGESVGDLMRRAAVALGRAADQGGGWCCFDPEMEEELTRRAVLESGIRAGLAAGDQFIPFYQPVFNLGDRRLVGFEALARWQHPDRGMISPADFIPAAEAAQLIQPMWEQLFERVCADLARWPDHLTCAVNLSPLQISDPEIVPKLLAICGRHDVSPSRIEAEITETGLFSSTSQAELVIRALKHAGVKMVLDDFGQEYSNFSRLIALAFDKIKIDQLYVRGMHDDPTKAAIVSTMIFLSHRLGIPANAEGIETESIAGLLAGEACALGQGYHLGRPMPAAAIDRLLAERAQAGVA